MSLAMIYCDDEGFHLAVESAGLIGSQLTNEGGPLTSKLLNLGYGKFAVVTGTIETWRVVKHRYKPAECRSVDQVAAELRLLIDNCGHKCYGEHALVCGFEGSKPICWKIDRLEKEDAVSIFEAVDPRQVNAIGYLTLDSALPMATRLITDGMPTPAAFKMAIETDIDSRNNPELTARPVEQMTIPKPSFD